MKASYFVRYGLLIAAVTVFLWPIVGAGALRALKSNKNNVQDWLPADYPETTNFKWFMKHFAGDEFILVSWDGVTFDDQRIRMMREKLVPEKRDSTRETDFYFRNVLSGADLVEHLTKEPLNLDRQEAIEKLKGSVVGRSGESTCMIFTLSDYGKIAGARKAVNRIRQVATQECNIPMAKLHLGGPAVDNAGMDEAGDGTVLRLASVACIVGISISWWCLRSFRLIAIVFFAGVYCAALSLAIVYYTGTTMNSILITMPALVYVAAISAAIHLSNYYRDTAVEEGLLGAPSRALQHAALPLGLATATTAIGLASLVTSELVPIRLFGVYSAIGVVASLLPLCFFVPAAFELWPLRGKHLESSGETTVAAGPTFSPRWWNLGQGIVRNHALVTVAGIVVLAFFGWGAMQVKTSTQLLRMFDPKSKIRADYVWLEKNIGDLVPMEVVFKFDNDVNELSTLDRMRLIEHLEKSIKGHHFESAGDLTSTMSAATFVGSKLYADATHRKQFESSPEKLLEGDKSVVSLFDKRASHSRVMRKKLEANRQQFIDLDFVEDEKLKDEQGGEKDYELWRVSARVSALADINFAHFQKELAEQVDRVLGDDQAKLAKGIEVVYTGLVPLIDKSQRSLLDGLVFGFVIDLVVVTIVMILAIREWSAGIVLLLPSIFPVVIVFGTMGLMGIIVDTGTVMAPGVALGVTIDDVVHFMLKYRNGLEQGLDRRQSIMMAYKGCARPMYQSWGVIGIGLSAFILSPFTPTQAFGYMMVTLLSAALIGNLVLLPAVLAGPFGSLFGRKFQNRAKPSPGDAPTSDEHTATTPHLRTHWHEETVAK